MWRSRSGSCLPVRHFVSFLCFADKCSRAYAANPLPRHAPAHICIELYLLLVAVVPPLHPPCSQRILVAKLSHLRQQCRRGCRCNWSRSWSWSRRHLCAALACIFLPFEFVKSTSINLSSVRCFGADSGYGSVAPVLAICIFVASFCMLGFILELRKFFGSCRRSLPAARNMKNLLVILQPEGKKHRE